MIFKERTARGLDVVSRVAILTMAMQMSALAITDEFDRSDGTDMSAMWTEQSGDWRIESERARSSVIANHDIMTFPERSSSPTLSVDVYYTGTPRITYAALISKYADASDFIRIKVQDNDGGGDFDTAYFYHGGSAWADMTGGSSLQSITPFTEARITTWYEGDIITLEIDHDFDGTPEETFWRGGIPLASLGDRVGVGGYGDAAFDNFTVDPPWPPSVFGPDPVHASTRIPADTLLSWNNEEGSCVVVPNDRATAEGDGGNIFPFGHSYPSQRYQQIYDSAQFVDAGTVSEIRFRVNGSDDPFSPTGMPATVYVGYSANPVTNPSAYFTNNIGSKYMMVYDGDLVLSSTASNGSPNEFDVVIDVDDVFSYNPAIAPLLLDVFIHDSPNTSTFDADGQATNQTATTRIFSLTNKNDVAGMVHGSGPGDDPYGLVTMFCFDGGAPTNGPGEDILVVETGSSIDGSVLAILDDFGVQYDFDDTANLEALDFSPYRTIILGANGGLVGEDDLAHLAASVNMGVNLILLGGSAIEGFAVGLNRHFIENDTNSYSWTSSSSPDMSVTYPKHWLASGLPQTNDFAGAVYSTRVTDSNAIQIAVNGDGHPTLVKKQIGAGDITFFTLNPSEGFWTDAGDHAYLETVIKNALSRGTTHDLYFGKSDPPALSSADQPLPMHDPTPIGMLDYNTRYYWQIISRNASGVDTGMVWRFDTIQEPVYSFTFDADPGWDTQGLWEFGVPLGGGTHNGDPTSGFTGTNVYGYNLAGDYTNSTPSNHYLTTPPFNCSDFLGVELSFKRWLGVENSDYDHATIDVSSDGVSWSNIWENPSGPGYTNVSDSSWQDISLDISSVADGQSNVYVRWGMGPSDSVISYPGWNIDDVVVAGNAIPLPPCPPNPTNDETGVELETLLTWSIPECSVVPNDRRNLEGDSNNVFPFSIGGWYSDQRYQQIYAPYEVGGRGTITEIRFRPDAVSGIPFGPISMTADIYLGYSANDVTNPSSTFADNIGAGYTPVHTGTLTLASEDVGGPPRDFDIVIDVDDVFQYDPDFGPLLLDVFMYTDPTTAYFDAHGIGTYQTAVTRIYSTGVSNATGVVNNGGPGTDPFGLVTKFCFAPSVLVFDDYYSASGKFAQEALDGLGIPYIDVGSDQTEFVSRMQTGEWDLVVFDLSSSSISAAAENSIESYLADGGRMLMFYWSMDTASALASNFEAQVVSDIFSPQTVYAASPPHQIWTDPTGIDLPLDDINDVMHDNGDILQPIGGGTILGSFTPGGGTTTNEAMILGNSGRTILHGVSPDEVGYLDGDGNGKIDRTELYENEILYLLCADSGETYDVYFGETASPTNLVHSDVTVPACDPSPGFLDLLDYGTTYYWLVMASNQYGSVTSVVWSFTTEQQPFLSFDMEASPGWTTEGAWAFGIPSGAGSHDGDPSSGYDGVYVYGYNLAGDYTNNLFSAERLTTTALDCRGFTNINLGFMRWLGVDMRKFDYATLQVSSNGASWTTVWTNAQASAISDDAWQEVSYDISAVADEQATVYLRWAMGPTDGSITYPGWNIDNVELLGDAVYTSNGVPIWWLIQHGLTNDPWAVEEQKDVDGDGATAVDEWYMRTIPTNQSSVLKVVDFGDTQMRHPIEFSSVLGHEYYLWCRTNLLEGDWTPWDYTYVPDGPAIMTPGTTPIDGTGSTVTIYVNRGPDEKTNYRIGVPTE